MIEFNRWKDKHKLQLSNHYFAVAYRYCDAYCYKFSMPVGRPLAKFMWWYNRKHPNLNIFSDEEINYWYTY